ncbi:MAG: Unknown protein [uncultured Sulfurovum sp.]|uniref:Uncharacterized protein n=1 Tax=uncultured Sulfurovum sp. TaxID=269237 RepID=A0A6S6TP61_9BACT|nr:MAG: Unknown protein [uncultured Sulfurovum sp.]
MIKNIIRILSVILIFCIIYAILYIKGAFYLKKIYISNIEILIPDNMHLSSVSQEGIPIQDTFSALPFRKQIDTYEFTNHRSTSFLFTSIDQNKGTDVLTLNLFPFLNQENHIKDIELNYEYKKSYEKIASKQCLIYIKNDNDSSDVSIFKIKEKIQIEIMSSNKKLANDIIHLFCTDVDIEV